MRASRLKSVRVNKLNIVSLLAVLLVFLLPYERIPSMDIYGATIRLSQLAALALIFASLPYLIRKTRILLAPQYILLGVFIFAYLLSALAAPDLPTAIKIFTFTAFVAATAVAISVIPDRKMQLLSYEKALAVTSAIVLVVGFYQYFGDIFGLNYQLTGLREAYTKSVFGFPRIQSTALEPLFLASFLLIPLSIFAAQHIKEGKKLLTWRAALIVVLACTIFLTVSRGAIIGLVCSTVFIALFTVRKNWRGFLKYFALLLLAGLLAFSLTAIENPFQQRVIVGEKGAQKQQRLIQQTTNLDSQSDRSRNRNFAIDAFKSSPVFGIGPGNFDKYAKNRFPEYRTLGNPAIVVNNLPLEILAESGILGFASLIAFLGYLFFSLLKLVLRGSGYLSIWALGLSSYMVATAVQYQTFSTFYVMHIWVVIGLTMALNLKPREGIESKIRK